MRFLKRLVPVLASTMVAGLFATTTLAQGQFGTAAEAKAMNRESRRRTEKQ